MTGAAECRRRPRSGIDRCAVFTATTAAVILTLLQLLIAQSAAKQDASSRKSYHQLQQQHWLRRRRRIEQIYLTVPPTIVSDVASEIAYRLYEQVEIPCVATGDPQPEYEWRKDGEPLEITGIDIRQLPGVGTIHIEDPTVEQHEGVYQCFASNEFGTAISIRTTLKKAVQEPFPSVREPKVHRPVVGNSLTLRCQPPYGYPPGVVYWGEFKSGDKLKPIENNERVSLDYDGNLHFSNIERWDASNDTSYVCVVTNLVLRSVVQGGDQRISLLRSPSNLHFSNIEMGDDRAGLHYVCIVQNTELRSLMQGDDQKIEPVPLSGAPQYQAPKIMWTSANKEVAIKSKTKKLKCIFAGYPTPRVRWRRLGGQMDESDNHFHHESFGQELVINNVQPADEDTYECIAENTESGQPRATHKTQLVVESPPYWKNNEPPRDVSTAEEESARFICDVEGRPTPTISWSVNGIPIEDLPSDRRRIVQDNYVYIQNVTKTDAQVLQCNASNKHGFVFANVFLNVLAEPPSFVNTLPSVTKIAESQTAKLICHASGSPEPVITWKKDEQDVIIGGRFRKDRDGNLHISDIRLTDEGRYYCIAVNKFGRESVNGLMLVRRKTEIVDPPMNQTVNVGTDVTLNCNATTDELEHRKLKISWLLNGARIEFGSRTNVAQYDPDKSLKITQAQIDNTGSYTCNASTELDWHAVTARLIVRGPPDPPYDVHLAECTTSRAVVEWSPGSDNNDPITEYVVYYNTSFDEPDRFTEGARVSSSRTAAAIRLRPWTNYTFNVQARNSLGLSEREAFTHGTCVTPQQRPYRNPENICSVSRGANQLVVVWEPIAKSDQHGERFYYIVSYRRRDISSATVNKVNVTGWQRSEAVIYNQEMFKEYEISVQSANGEGLAPAGTVELKLGYSGQDEPLDRPDNFDLDNSTLTSTSAEFTWDPVNQSVERVRGYFRGYQLVFWKNGDRSTNRTEDIILRSWDPCPLSPFRPSRRRRSQSVRGHTDRLWPYSQITAGVLVLNGGRGGKLSDTIDFNTPEGPPSTVRNLKVVEKGSHHLKVSWNKPSEENGLLRRYVLEYREMLASEQLNPVEIEDVEQTEYKIINLESDTKYIVYLFAVTIADGEKIFVEDSTTVLGAPSVPMITGWETGENFVNVSWSPTSQDSNDNPGHKFSVQYRKPGSDDEWTTVGPEAEHNWLNVSDLEPGSEYEFRVVAMNNGANATYSEPTIIYVGQQSEPVEQSAASVGLFIGLICILAFLLLILLLICLIRRNRGGKYAVYEKEKLRGHDSLRDDDDAGFGEYTRTDEPEPHKKSQTSLNSEEKPLDSETDSLGEYEDPDPSKFNEDGSFIGQYGGRKKSSEHIDQDGTTPSALSTFV